MASHYQSNLSYLWPDSSSARSIEQYFLVLLLLTTTCMMTLTQSCLACLILISFGVWLRRRYKLMAGKESKRDPDSRLQYRDLFPPRRIVNSKSKYAPTKATAISSSSIQVPLDASRNGLNGTELTPTGFTVADIIKLGRFPDYASLSGVPLPQCYHGFDIAKALSRPYRTFRWPYHQTMCT